MAKFRKKPVVIEAVQFTESTEQEVLQFVGDDCWSNRYRRLKGEELVLLIPTLEGDMTAQLGDWIINGVQGEFYPCKPDIFEATYEAVEGDD